MDPIKPEFPHPNPQEPHAGRGKSLTPTPTHTHTHSHTESARKEIARLLIKEMVMGPWWAEPFLARTAYMLISLTLCLNSDSTPGLWIEWRWHGLEYHPVFVPIPSVAKEWISLFSFSLLTWLFKIGLWKMGGWTWLVRVMGCESQKWLVQKVHKLKEQRDSNHRRPHQTAIKCTQLRSTLSVESNSPNL